MSFIPKALLISLLALLFSLHTMAQSIQEKKISGTYNNLTLKSFLDQMGKENGIRFYFKEEWVQPYMVNQTFDNQPLIHVLNSLFKEQSLTYRFFQDNSVVIFPKGADGRPGSKEDMAVMIIGDPLNEGRYKKARLRGKIIDGNDEEPLAGVIIKYPGTRTGIATNMKGDYSVELPTGDYIFEINLMGYEPIRQKIKLIENGTANFELFQETHSLGEVTVLGEESKATRSQMSIVKISAKTLKQLPVMMGEPDLIKSIIMMPGVQSVGEMSSGFNVRGGNTDQNLVLLNGSPVFNTSHLFGFFSMINPDAVRDVTLFKGGIPASYGERVSSIMDVQMKEGDTTKVKFYGGLGIINSRFTLEGPYVKKKKSTFLIGGRSTYSDWILRQTRNEQFINSIANFYDVNANTNLVLGANNELRLMGYFSSDKFNLNSASLYRYENQLASANWKINFAPQLISELNLAFSRYNFILDEKDEDLAADDYRLQTGIQYLSLKYGLSWLPNEKHTVKAGFQYMNYNINPGKISPSGEITNITEQIIPEEKSTEMGAYIEDDFDINERLSLSAGLRYSNFSTLGPTTVYLYEEGKPRSEQSVIDSIFFDSGERIKTYHGIEPRIALKYNLAQGSLRFSVQRIHQYVNQLSNTSVASPADFWKSSDYYIKPLVSDQIALGYFRNLKRNLFETSAEIYYKKLDNLTEYKNGATLVMNRYPETDIIQANGYAYGLELYLRKTSGRLNGWVSYTYSHTMRKTFSELKEEQINQNKYYPSAYDKPHDLSAVVNYNISRRWRFSGNFVLSSGRPTTLPELKYWYDGKQMVYYSDRNKYRMPAYHRLDLSITFDENLRKKRMWKGSWTFSIYNAYGRKNPYSIFYRKDPSIQMQNQSSYALYKLSVIGVPVPSITYNFKF